MMKRMQQAVTPCVGVWIETMKITGTDTANEVTPCVGVWIETGWLHNKAHKEKSHPAWVCGLKLNHQRVYYNHPMSHPAWVCGLKLENGHGSQTPGKSHPAWVCGLKQLHLYAMMWNESHTLRGCVD